MPPKDRHTSIHRWLLHVADLYPNFRYTNTHKWKYIIHSMSVPWHSLCLHLCRVGNLVWALLGDSTCNECRHPGLLQIRFRWMSYGFCSLVTEHNTRKTMEILFHTTCYFLFFLIIRVSPFLRTLANTRTHISRNCKEKDLEICAVELH